jgi:hypothetical protein
MGVGCDSHPLRYLARRHFSLTLVCLDRGDADPSTGAGVLTLMVVPLWNAGVLSDRAEL